MFKQACSVVKEAIDADNAKDYRKAFNLYQKSLTYFAHVIKCTAGERANPLTAKCQRTFVQLRETPRRKRPSK